MLIPISYAKRGGQVREKLRTLVEKYWDILSYLFFGGLTTLVNFLVYTPMFSWTQSATLSNVIAWVISVAFAYGTNKPFVFKSYDWSLQTVLPELGKFVGCRVASGVLETVVLALTVDILHWPSLWMKVIVSVLTVILNYVGSKLLVFRKKSEKEESL